MTLTMTMQTNPGTGSNTPQVPVTPTFKLSATATFLLSHLSDMLDSGAPVTVQSLPENTDAAFEELMQCKLVEVDTSGTGIVKPTKEGLNALDKRIVKVYPLVPQGTAERYNLTLLSMTESAANALFHAIATVGQALTSKLHKRTLDRFLASFMDTGVFRRVSPETNERLYDTNKESLEYYNSKNPFGVRTANIFREARHWEEQLLKELGDRVEELGKIQFKQPVALSSAVQVTGLEPSDDGIIANCKDTFTGETMQITEAEMNFSISTINQLIIQTA